MRRSHNSIMGAHPDILKNSILGAHCFSLFVAVFHRVSSFLIVFNNFCRLSSFVIVYLQFFINFQHFSLFFAVFIIDNRQPWPFLWRGRSLPEMKYNQTRGTYAQILILYF